MADIQTPDNYSQVIPVNPQIQTIHNQVQIPYQSPQMQQPQQQTFIVYAPQLNPPKPQFNLNQVQHIQQPQFQPPQNAIPPQQQQYVQNQQQPQIMQPLLPIVKQEEILKHDSLKQVGKMERRYFNLQVIGFFLLFQAFALILCCTSYQNNFIEFQYNPNGHFKVPFYIITVIMSLSLIYTYLISKKQQNKQINTIICVVFGITYGFFIQALYSSTYYDFSYYQYGSYHHFLESNGHDVIVIIVYSFINLEALSIFSYTFQELDQLSFKSSFWYIVIPTISFGGILFSLYDKYNILWGIICGAIAFGFYLQFILSRIHKSTKFNLRSDDGQYAAVLFSFLILFPFFDMGNNKSDEMIQESQSQESQQKNVQ